MNTTSNTKIILFFRCVHYFGYSSNGNFVALPCISPQITYSKSDYHSPLNEDQITAIETCLKSALCYIWGPPGSGKTRHVLTNAVFSYYGQPESYRIGVFAPTNNSLEQIMSALICTADAKGIPRNKFFRIGTPSQNFASEYPEVCEISGIEKKRKEIKKQLQILTDVINCRLGEYAINSAESLLSNLSEIHDLLIKRDNLLLETNKMEIEISSLKKKTSSILFTLKNMVSSKEFGAEILLRGNTQNLIGLNGQIDKIEEDIKIRFARIKRVETGSNKIDDLVRELTYNNIENISKCIVEIKEKTKDYLLLKNSHIAEYKSISTQELYVRKASVEDSLKNLDSQDLNVRINGSFVLGATFDSYVGRFQNSRLSLSHIFIDEAGYVPLIKSLVLFNCSTPITFLGDHNQLPPVCEMDSDELTNTNNNDVILWSVPSIYSDSVFKLDRSTLINNLYINNIQHTVTQRVELRVTHRFGPNLAEILDRLFYKFGFRSSEDSASPVKFYIIDAPFSKKVGRRGNVSEVLAIQKLIGQIPNENYIVLTPYKEQVALINTEIPLLRRDSKVLTIHKSQGREWDTVIMSIVDCQYIIPWYTDTTEEKSKGAQVMNTAISRVKKELYIICVKSFWLSREDHKKQLISNLIAQAKIIEI